MYSQFMMHGQKNIKLSTSSYSNLFWSFLEAYGKETKLKTVCIWPWWR